MSMPSERITIEEIESCKERIISESLLVDVNESARLLSCSPRTVYDLVRDGHIHGYSRNFKRRGLRFLAAELRDYVRSIKIDKEKWRE